jgi:hypothetical protein
LRLAGIDVAIIKRRDIGTRRLAPAAHTFDYAALCFFVDSFPVRGSTEYPAFRSETSTSPR